MSKKVLTIDDSKTVRLIVKKHLAPFGVEIIDAENGEQGVARAREDKPDLILLDYNMPVMDGYQTLVELKHDPSTRSIPVVMLTTETVQETVVKLIKLGLRDFIAKPFTGELLLKKVNPILSLYEGAEPPDPQSVSARSSAAPNPSGSEGKTVVLAIDDKENILKLLESYLGERFHVITAGSGAAAKTAMKQFHFDYMFLDLTMDVPWTDIFASYADIKKEESSPEKVAVMTLRTAEDDIARASGLGIHTVLYKPFAAPDVAKAIAGLRKA